MIQWCSGQSRIRADTIALITPRETPPGGCEMDQGLTDFRVQWQFRERRLDGDMEDWKSGTSSDLDAIDFFNYGIVLNSSTMDGLQMRFLQLEHGGGLCNCWSLSELSVTVNGVTTEPE